jgi:hypothetical protein
MSLRGQVDRLLYPARQELRSLVTLHPSLYLPLVRLDAASRDQAVHAGTEIVIEGFPRCGNSFAVDAFLAAQGRPVRVAHHLHAAAQIVAGVKRDLPVLLLIRDPDEATVSFKALQLQASQRDRGQPIATSLRLLFRSYARFYERVWPLRDHLVVGLFDQVTRDLGGLIRRVNARFDTDFQPFTHSDDQVRAIRASQSYHAAPSDERHALKAPLARELTAVADTPETRAARAVYSQFVAHSRQTPQDAGPPHP